jgi:hypothetical protein
MIVCDLCGGKAAIKQRFGFHMDLCLEHGIAACMKEKDRREAIA